MSTHAAEDACIAILRRAHEADRRAATVHERKACPKPGCLAPIGQRCRHVANGRPLTRSHEERWTLEVPKR